MRQIWPFGRGLDHKIKNFDEAWVENARPRILISYKFFHITAMRQSWSLALDCLTTKHERILIIYRFFHIKSRKG